MHLFPRPLLYSTLHQCSLSVFALFALHSLVQAELPKRLPLVTSSANVDPVYFAPPAYQNSVNIDDLYRPNQGSGSVFHPASTQFELAQPIVEDPIPPAKAPGQRDGVFQKINGRVTWIPAPSSGDLGSTELYLDTVWGVPFPTRESPLVITPSFGVTYLDGPITPDLPGQVHSTGIQFRWFRPIGDRWTVDLAVMPGFYSDFDNTGDDALRITGHGFGIWKWSEQATFALGVMYLDRSDIDILPAGGVIWKPNDDWNFELLFPQPKIARRILVLGADCCEEYWAYVGGEFGGDVWAIERASGADDQIIMRDYRILLGIERKVIGGLTSRFEVGYVFNRRIEYKSATPDYEPGDTLLLRTAMKY